MNPSSSLFRELTQPELDTLVSAQATRRKLYQLVYRLQDSYIAGHGGAPSITQQAAFFKVILGENVACNM